MYGEKVCHTPGKHTWILALALDVFGSAYVGSAVLLVALGVCEGAHVDFVVLLVAVPIRCSVQGLFRIVSASAHCHDPWRDTGEREKNGEHLDADACSMCTARLACHSYMRTQTIKLTQSMLCVGGYCSITACTRILHVQARVHRTQVETRARPTRVWMAWTSRRAARLMGCARPCLRRWQCYGGRACRRCWRPQTSWRCRRVQTRPLAT